MLKEIALEAPTILAFKSRECPYCEGTGTTRRFREDQIYFDPCVKCHGSGLIPLRLVVK